MEAKPICVIYIPVEEGPDGRRTTWSDCVKSQERFDKDKPDYHWFFLLDYDIQKVELKVFYEKDFAEIQYQELKSMIEEAIKKPISSI